ncbi:SDR family NAD(P)-dependent oxidoreductase [Candidatus Saccharibacteria bacterium]|nr:SDR family NAD(P)-dependent oxidoreductase [Candidatus Saccharibacteria bacterium]
MQGKTVIITGASDGIGKAAARELKSQGAEVVIIGRSPEKTIALAQELDAMYYIADFSDLNKVRELAEKLLATYPRIDVLANNAGGIFGKRELTTDGFEKTMQVNHLSHFLLTSLLLNTLIASKATIINTSSVANELFARLDIHDINMERRYSSNMAYGNAKLENILFTKELQRRYGEKGISVAAFHPGNVATSFASDSNSILRFIYQTPLKRVIGLTSPEVGAETLVWLASTTPNIDWQPGQYYYKKKIEKTNAMADDENVAKSLWRQSEAMTKS